MDNPQAKLEFLSHKKQEWDDFFNSPKWKKVVERGQEVAESLQHKLLALPVRDLNGVIELLSIRSQLIGVLQQGLVADDIMREIYDEIDVVNKELGNG